MDPQFRTSFIPKKPIVAAPTRSSSSIGLFSLLATVLFIVTVAVSGGIFFYQKLLNQQIDTDKASLDRARGAFEPDIINQIIRLDSRIETGKKLLASHLAVTPFFDFLGGVTLKSVRFKDFNFSYISPDKIVVLMKGQATSYAAVALESDLLNAQKKLSSTIISDLALDPQGTVSFSVSTVLDPSLVSFSSIASAQPVQTAPADATASTAQASGTTTSNSKAQ
ncbi:MAG TPA: hypothetical protein VHE10_02645 [Candidatus Paceibacterota bacterium]|nr:hypothetical protein [Candidatus Paceibacterota bacterium]